MRLPIQMRGLAPGKERQRVLGGEAGEYFGQRFRLDGHRGHVREVLGAQQIGEEQVEPAVGGLKIEPGQVAVVEKAPLLGGRRGDGADRTRCRFASQVADNRLVACARGGDGGPVRSESAKDDWPALGADSGELSGADRPGHLGQRRRRFELAHATARVDGSIAPPIWARKSACVGICATALAMTSRMWPIRRKVSSSSSICATGW